MRYSSYALPDAEKLAGQIRDAAKQSFNEEQLRIKVEHLLRDYLSGIGIHYDSLQEHTVGERSRLDSLYGKVDLEYKRPGLLSNPAEYEKAVTKAKQYLEDLSVKDGFPIEEHVAILLDGFNVGFVRYENGWRVTEQYSVDKYSVLLILESFRALGRKPLSPELMVRDFGPSSSVAKECIKLFWEKLGDIPNEVGDLFNEWKLLFQQVTGYQAEEVPEITRLASEYEIENGDIARIFFAIHTYFALVIKILAAELVAIHKDGGTVESFVESLVRESDENLKEKILELENGGVFRALDIENFLEGDVFGWYLSIWDDESHRVIRNLIMRFREYEPATTVLEPDRARDLLKRLYQNLVPRSIRHDLGEFYTPDWLAELVYEKVGYDGNLNHKVIDPTCGSGTFLVIAIRKAIEWARKNGIPHQETLKLVVSNITGIDLNPLAVIAARTNYLMGIGPLLRYQSEPIEIPIFLADAIESPEENTEKDVALYSISLRTHEQVSIIKVPSIMVRKGVANRFFSVVDRCLMARCDEQEFYANLEKELNFFEWSSIKDYVLQIYRTYNNMPIKQKSMWVRWTKNRLSSTPTRNYDFVVGNPSWVKWSQLPEKYREAVKSFWKNYGLFSSDRYFGGVESDIALVLTHSAIDKWLKLNGKIGYLITQTVWKSESAEGFRMFTIPGEMWDKKDVPFKITEVHDMVSIKPFEGASNRTSLFVAVKGEKTTYPVPYIKWEKLGRRSIPQETSLTEVINEKTKRIFLTAKPVVFPGGPWLTISPSLNNIAEKAIGNSGYQARKGVTTDLNGVYWIEAIEKRADGKVRVRNLNKIGRHKVRAWEGFVETDYIYPLVRGREIKAFNWTNSGIQILLPQKEYKGFDEELLRSNALSTYQYFSVFKEQLLRRSSFKKYHSSSGAPFYSCFNVGPYTFSPYKVVWREVQSIFEAAVIGSVYDDIIGEKIAIPDHKLFFIPLEDEKEAHYICAFLNSKIVREIIHGYSVSTQVATHVTDYIKIPQFDSKNSLHIELSDISVKAHKGEFDNALQNKLEAVVKRILE